MNTRYHTDPDWRASRLEKAKARYRAKAEEIKAYQKERRARLRNDPEWVEKNNAQRYASARTREQAAPLLSKLRRVCYAAKSRARNAGYESDLTPGFLLELWRRQNGCCAVTQVPLEICFGEARSPANGVSIDRIDCTQGYYKNNVRLTTYIYNIARQDRDDAEVLAFAEALVAAQSRAHG